MNYFPYRSSTLESCKEKKLVVIWGGGGESLLKTVPHFIPMQALDLASASASSFSVIITRCSSSFNT